MVFDKIVESRRTCRDYQKKEVPLDKVAEILETAHLAPSSGNLQNWQFIVVRDQKKREKISKISTDQVWMADAPVHIIICNNKDDVLKEYPGKGELYSTQNCAIAATHLMLKAEELKLVTAWIGAFDSYELGKLLDIPDNITPEIIITLGYPNTIDEDQYREDIKFLTFFETHGKKTVKEKDFWPIAKHLKKK